MDPSSVPEGPWWVQLVYVVIAAVMSLIASPWLLRKAAEAKAMAADASLSARKRLTAMVREYVCLEAANIAEKRFPELAQWIAKDSPNADAIKEKLREWGKDLKARAVSHFKTQGLDVVATLGDDMLDELIESAANRVSPFPGADTAKALLQEHVSDWLVNKGVEYARSKWLEGTS